MTADFRLSPQSIDALAEVISGGPANATTPPIGLYRSGPQLEKFMRGCNIEFNLNGGSRVPSLVDCLLAINNGPDTAEILPRIFQKATEPRDFITAPEKLTRVIDYMNQYLVPDGFELRHQGQKVVLVPLGKNAVVIDHLVNKIEVIDFDTVARDIERALESCDRDPEDAVTAACSAVESVCRSVLIALDLGLPAKQDITGLYKAVRDPLGLSPQRSDLPGPIADDARKVLSGLATMIDGIGALRTHAGDAHGRERGFARIDSRIARLAIHSASTAALFIIETWQKKCPTKTLVRH